MCWWTGLSKCQYVRNQVDLRNLADIIKNHIGDILDRTIYPICRTSGPVKMPYTMDNDMRPEIVAILIEMLDANPNTESTSEDSDPAKMYPRSAQLAKKIIERKTVTERTGVTKHSKFMAESIEINVLAWHRQIKIGQVRLPKIVRHRVLLFAETIVRAAQIYDETLMRNRAIWDTDAQDYVPEAESVEFNWAFDMFYIELAAADMARE